MMICATARYVTRDKMAEARHELFQNPERVIFDPVEDSRQAVQDDPLVPKKKRILVRVFIVSRKFLI
jgi:hypothetical protein